LNFSARRAYNFIELVTLLFIAVIVLGLIATAIYFWQQPANTSETIELPAPPQARGLFSDYQPKPAEDYVQPVVAEPTAAPQDKALVQQAIEHWQESPDRNSAAEMLHTAALSDDAATYETAVELALQSWREGKLRDVSAVELQSLFSGEFWLLSSAARSSGAGFVLKRTLANANRELAGTNNPN
jgi:hypothetical protein